MSGPIRKLLADWVSGRESELRAAIEDGSNEPRRFRLRGEALAAGEVELLLGDLIDGLEKDREILRDLGVKREAHNVARAAYCDVKNPGESINLGEAARNAHAAYYEARHAAGKRARELAGEK